MSDEIKIIENQGKTAERFNKWARSYDYSILQTIFFGPIQEKVIKYAKKYVSRPLEILDIGCGTGHLIRKLALAYTGSALTGLDNASVMIDKAQSLKPLDLPINFIKGTAENLPFPDSKFDIVFTTMSFHHWSDQNAGLKEVSRVMRSGGIFIFADHMHEGFFRFIGFKEDSLLGRFLKFNELNAMFESLSLDIIEHHSIFCTKALQVIVCRKENK